ncbi:MAG: M23 family metallopeptidase [Chloroflexota bacterium]|nr:M23 family metallopeptidase [Chloroflexota bacterium]
MSQNRKKKSSNRGNPRRSSNNRPLGGGGPPPGSGSEGNRRSDSQDRTRQISTIIAVIMLVAIILPVLVGACFYRDTGAAPYDWAHPAEQVPSANSNYDNARFLRRDTAETAPTASLPAPQLSLGDNQFYVGETGHYIVNGFLTFWRNRGGQVAFGNPLSEEFQQNGRTVQLFEYALFEYHPEVKNTSNEVQLGFLGRQLAEERGLKFNSAPVPATSSPAITYFSETAHSLGGLFKPFWEKNSGLALLGFPISEELPVTADDDNTVVQYFERGRLEQVKDGQGQKVVFSAAGELLLEAKGWQRPTRFNLELDIEGNEIWQGRTLALRLFNQGWNWVPQKLQGSVGKDALRFIQAGSVYKAFEAFAPNLDPKAYPLNVLFYDPAGRPRQISRSIQVTIFDFALQRLTIPDEKSALLDASADDYDTRILAPVYSTFTPQILWSGKWGWPVVGQLTTEFGQGRIYNDRPQDPNYYHGGLDLAQSEGAAVLAPAAGKVLYTGELKARGNAVAVDHGMGVISFYYHLSAISSKVGQEVKVGDLLGKVGTTGRSDGPHLHWEVRVNGVPTDPRTFQKIDLSN